MPDLDPTDRELSAHLGDPDAAKHPSMQLLLAAGQQVLPPDVESRVQAHLEHCYVCSQLLKDMATLPEASLSPSQVQRISATMPASAPGTAAFPRRRMIPVLGTIAALLLLTAGLARYVTTHAVSKPQTTAASPQASEPATTAELEIPLSPLPPPAGNTVALQTRGASANPSIEILRPAFTAYNKGDYAAAEQRFTPLLTAYPSSEIVPLYLGVSQLYLGENQQAYDTLALAQRNADPAALATAQWYAAITAQRLHRPQARELLMSICTASSSNYATVSCRIAPTLP